MTFAPLLITKMRMKKPIDRQRDERFLDGAFLGLHLIRKGHCRACDEPAERCIFYKSTEIHETANA